jgi:peptidoglycan hydrolase CwlO-like protein
MKRIVTIVGIAIATGLVLGAVGFPLGRYTVRKDWEREQAQLRSEIRNLTTELDGLNDQIRKTRQAAREVRARVNPLTTRPRPKGPSPLLQGGPATRPMEEPEPPLAPLTQP